MARGGDGGGHVNSGDGGGGGNRSMKGGHYKGGKAYGGDGSGGRNYSKRNDGRYGRDHDNKHVTMRDHDDNKSNHSNRHRVFRNGAWIWVYGPGYYAGGDCYWLLQRAQVTGSPYWWSRYEDCVGYY